jgi:pimeloyl-ACP methyl ester carboxylesterase
MTSLHEAEAAVFASDNLEPRVRKLQLQKTASTARVLETGAGEPVLLLHAICLGSAHWSPVMSRVCGVRSMALDMPGHGESDGADYTDIDLRRWHRTFMEDCLDALDLDSVHFVGHSYGGMFALWLALDAPHRVRSVTLVGAPSVAFGARPDATLRMLARQGVGRAFLTLPSPLPVYRQVLAVSLGRPAIAAASPELLRATYLGTRRIDFPLTVSSYLREQFRGASAEPSRYVLGDEELARVERPVLILWGDRDVRYQSIAQAQDRAALLPDARFEIVAGGHEPWLENPTPCAEIFSDFLLDHSGSRVM